MNNILYKKGMTLIETLVAIGIMSILVMATTSVFINLSKGERRNQTITEVESQASFIAYQIAQSARNASAIISPSQGSSSNSLSLSLPTSTGENPTQYQLNDGKLMASYGDGNQVQLSSNTVIVTNLTFQNLTAPDTKGSIQISFTISNRNVSNDQRLNYSTNRITTITLR